MGEIAIENLREAGKDMVNGRNRGNDEEIQGRHKEQEGKIFKATWN